LRRTCVVELIVDEEDEKRLRRLCDFSSKLWNEINHIRLKTWLLMTPVTPSPGRGNGRRPGQGLNPQKRGDVAQTSPPK